MFAAVCMRVCDKRQTGGKKGCMAVSIEMQTQRESVKAVYESIWKFVAPQQHPEQGWHVRSAAGMRVLGGGGQCIVRWVMHTATRQCFLHHAALLET